METKTCKTCGCDSLIPMQVVVDEDKDEITELLGGGQESRFYSCQVCGDNWLAVKETAPDGECTVTYVHQMGTSPVLKRVAHLSNHVVLTEEAVDDWKYYLGDEPVPEEKWHDKLSSRRDVLKSVCMN